MRNPWPHTSALYWLFFFFFGRNMVTSISFFFTSISIKTSLSVFELLWIQFFFLQLALFTMVLTYSLTNMVLWFAFASPVHFHMEGFTEGLVPQQCCHKQYPSNKWSSPLQMTLLNSCLWGPLFINDANTRKHRSKLYFWI